MVTDLVTKYIEECRKNNSTDHTEFVKDLFRYLRYGELSKNFKKMKKSLDSYRFFTVYLYMIFREKTNNLTKGKISYE